MLAILPGPATAHAIYRGLLADGERIGLTTIYRQLAFLAGRGVIGTGLDQEGRHLYHLRPDDHHLICFRCGRAVLVDASAVLAWATGTASANGFSDITVSINLSGLCVPCPAE